MTKAHSEQENKILNKFLQIYAVHRNTVKEITS